MSGITIVTNTPKAVISKHESHKLHIALEAEGRKSLLTFSAALVASNTINGTVNGNPIPQVTFAVDSDSTMAAIAAAIASMAGVKSANVIQVAGGTSNDRVIEVISEDPNTIVSLTGWAVTNGASQATITISVSDKRIKLGMPVQINALGKLEPLTAANAEIDMVGVCIQEVSAGEEATIAARGYMVVKAKASGAVTPGKVAYAGYDMGAGRPLVTSSSVTAANLYGWALAAATADAEVAVVVW
jgi:hypothetical protein